MNSKRYEGFTLIEMLVVMGILIILMVVGIAAGRFALFRASDVAHRNAADQIFEGLQAYYIDNRAYPKTDGCGAEGNTTCNPALLMLEQDQLRPYLDVGAFNGGSGATFFYFVGGDNDDQAALVCVSMRGTKEVNDIMTNGAYYCSGNGFDTDLQGFPSRIDTNLIEVDDDTNSLWSDFVDLGADADAIDEAADWDNGVWVDYEDLYDVE